MRILFWVFWGFVFFALFAFALNNKTDTTVHWFFGVEWHTSTVIVVATSFIAGLIVGALAMVPSLWRQHRRARRQPLLATPATRRNADADAAPVSDFFPDHPPREGL
jgi:uncharacterized integral membrane protein